MFGLNTIERPKAAPVPPAGFIPATKYDLVAKRINYQPPNISVLKMRDFLSSNNITAYPLEKVSAWMDHKTRKHKYGWLWRPLRDQDRINFEFGTKETRGRRESRWVYYRDFCGQNTRRYPHVVPLHALEKIAMIEAAFPSARDQRPFFTVADFAPAEDWKVEYRPDPFLMVCVPEMAACENGMGRFVIDFWDEPGFGL